MVSTLRALLFALFLVLSVASMALADDNSTVASETTAAPTTVAPTSTVITTTAEPTTEAPITTTTLAPTDAPTTTTPATTTEVPATTTEVPATTTTAEPVTTTAAPVTTTAAPATTTAAPTEAPTTTTTETPTTTIPTTTTPYPSYKAIAYGKKGVEGDALRASIESFFTASMGCALHADCDIAYVVEESDVFAAHAYFRVSAVRSRFVADVRKGDLADVASAIVVTDVPMPTRPAEKSEAGVIVGVIMGFFCVVLIVAALLVYRSSGYRGVVARGEREALV